MSIDVFCDIVMLTYNKQELTKNCIDSFLANTKTPCRLIVIDNCSTDETREYLSTLKDTSICKFKVIFNRENRGFVGGMNQGIELSRAPYICLANNDLLFGPGWLAEMISVFAKFDQVGLLNPNSNSLGARIPSGSTLSSYSQELTTNYKNVFTELPFCIGFCMMIKRQVVEKAGGLSDEFYPMFFEDTDYSLKVQKCGYLIGVAKAAYVWHKEHGSLKQLGPDKEKNFLKSKATFVRKWGRILRVAGVVNNEQELLEVLHSAVDIARSGNYVWIFTRGYRTKRSEVFKKCGLLEHSGVNFIPFNNSFGLFWKIVKKKKRYDVIIDSSCFRRRLLKGYNLFDRFDPQAIEAVKHSV